MSLVFEGKAKVPFETPCLCNIGHIANNCLTSICIVCIYEYLDDYLPTTDWLRRCWGWPRGIVHRSMHWNITKLWLYPNFHYMTLSTYRNLSASSWIKKMNFIRIVGCLSFTFVGIAGCMILNFNALIYNSFWNFWLDQKIIEVWITVVSNNVYNKITNALGYKVWIGLNWRISECVNYTHRSMKLKGGILISLCPSVFPSVSLSFCPSFHPSVDKIVSALYLQQYSPDTFHIYTSYQETSEGVLHVKLFFKIQNFWQIL